MRKHQPFERIFLGVCLSVAVFYSVLFLAGHQLVARERIARGGDDPDQPMLMASLETRPPARPVLPDHGSTIEFLGAAARTDPSVLIRQEAVIALGKVGEIARPELEALLTDPHWLIRVEAADQLGLLLQPASIPALLQALQGDSDPWVQYKAGEALAAYGADALPFLRAHLLYSESAGQRALCARLLARSQVADARGDYLILLRDSHPRVRQAAAEHAAEWSDPDLAGALVALLDDPDQGVAAAATAALARIPEAARRHALARIENEARAAREQGYHLLATVGTTEDLPLLEERWRMERYRNTKSAIRSAQRAIRQRAEQPLEAGAALSPIDKTPVLLNEFYLVVDCPTNTMSLLRGGRVLRTCAVATGMNRRVGRWYFSTPRGEFSILDKIKDPLWYRPDWAWAEKGQPVPTGPERWRGVPGVMGKYKLELGHGYAIHGTNQPQSLGRNATHGCIRVGALDLEAVYGVMEIGDRVFIY